MKLTNNLYLYPEQGMLDCNTYVITGDPGVIIDPGNAEFIQGRIDGLKQDGIDPADIGVIINTHLHIDHCGANRAFKELSGARIAMHPVQRKITNWWSLTAPGFSALSRVSLPKTSFWRIRLSLTTAYSWK